MAVLAVLVEDPGTLLLNEFFDYDGRCYAISRSRTENNDICIDFQDFYDSDVSAESMHDIPVIFIIPDADTGDTHICGWYRHADTAGSSVIL